MLFVILAVGRSHHECQFEICSCSSEAKTLLEHGFWPLSPSAPTTAVAVYLLDLQKSLLLNGHVPLKAFVDSVSTMENQVFYVLIIGILLDFRSFGNSKNQGKTFF